MRLDVSTPLMAYVVLPLIKAFVIINVMAVMAGVLTLVERRVLAWIQIRKGPNRVGPQGILQWVADTIKRADGGTVAATVDRSTLWAAQTPQVFRTEALRAALQVDRAAREAATDEAMLIEAAGGTVLLHEVTEPNLKVTTGADLKVAELLLGERA